MALKVFTSKIDTLETLSSYKSIFMEFSVQGRYQASGDFEDMFSTLEAKFVKGIRRPTKDIIHYLLAQYFYGCILGIKNCQRYTWMKRCSGIMQEYWAPYISYGEYWLSLTVEFKCKGLGGFLRNSF